VIKKTRESKRCVRVEVAVENAVEEGGHESKGIVVGLNWVGTKGESEKDRVSIFCN
jgi:hypothetical protein